MADDRRRDDGAGGTPGERRGGQRSAVAVQVRCHYDSVLDFVETQAVNISVMGMFIATDSPAPVGTRVDFQFTLSDGFTLLAGSAEVMRIVTSGPINGMGVRFQDLDSQYRRLIERIVAVNADEGRSSTVNFDYARPAAAEPAPPAPAAPAGTMRHAAPPPPPGAGATRSLTPAAPGLTGRAPAPPPAMPGGTRQMAAPGGAQPPRPLATTGGPRPVALPPTPAPAPAPAGRSSVMSAAAPAPDPPVTRSGILPAAPAHVAQSVQLSGRSLRVVLGPTTAAHFTSNPLLNVRSGGFFIPLEEDVGLGTVLDVEIVDGGGRPVVTGKGKVVAKQQLRVGVRLSDMDKDGMARLQGEVAKLSSAK